MKSLIPAALAALLTLAPAAIAQPGGPAPGAAPAHAPRSCFWKRNIEGFAAADEQHLYMRVGIHDVYELKMFSDCLSLDWVHHLGLRTFGGDTDICEGPNPGVEVIVNDMATGHQRCQVTNIRRLSPDEISALPKLARP